MACGFFNVVLSYFSVMSLNSDWSLYFPFTTSHVKL